MERNSLQYLGTRDAGKSERKLAAVLDESSLQGSKWMYGERSACDTRICYSWAIQFKLNRNMTWNR